MQLPFSGKLPGGCVSVEERQERRAQQLRRLQEINARRREEKLLQDQERLDRLMAVQARDLLSHLQFIPKVAVLHSCKMSSCNNTAGVSRCELHSNTAVLCAGASGGRPGGSVSQEPGGAQHGLC